MNHNIYYFIYMIVPASRTKAQLVDAGTYINYCTYHIILHVNGLHVNNGYYPLHAIFGGFDVIFLFLMKN